MKIKVHYAGRDLGASYTRARTRFCVWAPTADAVRVRLFAAGLDSPALDTIPMTRGSGGTWRAVARGDLKSLFYTYSATVNGQTREAVDPYARATGANGRRAQIVDLRKTNPPGWAKDKPPKCEGPTNAVIYELHVRDATIRAPIAARTRGKFLGVGGKFMLDHLRRLGVTHVHLLPAFDFESVDETRPDKPQYNWGYDPQNYNVPEGSYSTNARDGRVRIREFKQMVMALHKAGIRVVMDVVYNHTYRAKDSNFNALVPGYYYRQNADGGLSNGSGCGNETASDRPMFRKFMVDSLAYWANEFHVDGFRFDLMGLHDLGTMRAIRAALDRVDPSILLYGEGWTAGDTPLRAKARATKDNIARLRGVAAFNDGIRDALKGPVWDKKAAGFVAGATGREEAVKAGIVASTRHPQVEYPKGDAWRGPWAREPGRCITYDSCHDNHTLWDKLELASPRVSERERIKMNKLCAAVILTAQGVPFIHAGEEFLRTKRGEENSYNKPDAINALDWSRRKKYRDVFDYYRGLIAIRKKHAGLRLRTAAEIRKHVRFIALRKDRAVGFTVNSLVVIFNARNARIRVSIPAGRWGVLANDEGASVSPRAHIGGGTAVVAPRSALILEQMD